MKKELIAFKGVKEGIFINVSSGDFSAIKEELHTKMKDTAHFYQGTKLLGIKSEDLSPEEKTELGLILKYKYDLIIEEDELPAYISTPSNDKSGDDPKENKSLDDDTGMTKFVQGTIRSGQVIEYNGSIVIVGDVNPGALIKADGNIIVLGSLRGVAHAGSGGSHDAIVAAYKLQPTQLRIGDIITRPPDEEEGSLKMPEIAKIKEGEVIIEPYLPNK